METTTYQCKMGRRKDKQRNGDNKVQRQQRYGTTRHDDSETMTYQCRMGRRKDKHRNKDNKMNNLGKED